MDTNIVYKYTIYKITNKLNHKIYIGMHKTKNLQDNYMGSGKLIKRAIKKYGVENFTKEILFIFDASEEMFNKEKEIVNQLFIESDNTYNIIEGGFGDCSHMNKNGRNLYGQNGDINHGGKNLLNGNKIKEFLIEKGLFEEWKQKVSTSLKEKWKRDGFHWTGRKHKDESKKKMSADRKGKYTGKDNSNYGNCWVYSDLESKNKTIKKTELNEYINNGWKSGIKMKYHKKVS